MDKSAQEWADSNAVLITSDSDGRTEWHEHYERDGDDLVAAWPPEVRRVLNNGTEVEPGVWEHDGVKIWMEDS